MEAVVCFLLFIRRGRATNGPEPPQKSCACPSFFFSPPLSFEEVAWSDYKERGDGYKEKNQKE